MPPQKLIFRIKSIIGRKILPLFDFSVERLDKYAPRQGVGDLYINQNLEAFV
jgi:hypothetical protein